MKTRKSIYLTFIAGLTCLLLAISVSAAALTKGYTSDDAALKIGMTAALSESTPAEPKVKRASLDDDDKIIGVVTTPDNDLVTIGSADPMVYVQTSGEVNALVSDVNGVVKNGDLVVVSPLKGVLMKADDNPAIIVGIALEDFASEQAETKSIQQNGGTKDVKVAQTRINLDHKVASNQQALGTDSSLERLGRAVTGREVGELRVLAALVIFLIVLVAEGGIIYGAISTAITALGRNPLARKVIQGEVLRVILIAFVVLCIGIGAIYLILWI